MFLENLKQLIGQGVSEEFISYPPKPEMGDLALSFFMSAKKQGLEPQALALGTAEKLSQDPEINKIFAKIVALGPYANFFINPAYLAQEVLSEIKKDGELYGRSRQEKDKKIVIEFSNGNTHKEFHIGHLRNISFGQAIVNILNFNGYRAIPISYINDFGIHVAKTIWQYQKDIRKYNDSSDPKGYLLGQIYAEASKNSKDNEIAKAEISETMKQIEGRRGPLWRLFKKTRRWSIKYFAQIYKELNLHFRKTFYESRVIKRGWQIVDELIAKNILIKSQGAIIADLSNYNLGVLPIIRSDGTALYPVADLALAKEKYQKFKMDESIYVVDIRQSLYFQQLFKILELSGQKNVAMRQLPYEFVSLPQGLMSSREGNVISYHEFSQTLKAKIYAETKFRHPNWPEDQINDTAEKIALATIKFEMLKVSPQKIIVFDMTEALRFDGYTVVYLLYTVARINSIFRKAKLSAKIKGGFLGTEIEKNLLIKMAKFPEVVKTAGATYDPAIITRYLFELSQIFNDYYNQSPILKSEPEFQMARLALLQGVLQVLKNGLELLNISTINEI